MVLKGIYSIKWKVLFQVCVLFYRRQTLYTPRAVFASIFSAVNKTFLRYESLEPKRRVRYEMLIKTKSDVRRQETTSLYFA
jgi:hypothetical protein